MNINLKTMWFCSILILIYGSTDAQNCLLIDCVDTFTASSTDIGSDKTFYKLEESGPQYYGIFANKTDTLVYDFIFKPYDGSCGSKLRVWLEESLSGRIMYDSTYTIGELKYLYLTKYAEYSNHLIIRLNLENHPTVFLGDPDVLFFKLKIEAIDNKGIPTLMYGKKGDKIFVFNNEPN
jgi:hypothetical protein